MNIRIAKKIALMDYGAQVYSSTQRAEARRRYRRRVLRWLRASGRYWDAR